VPFHFSPIFGSRMKRVANGHELPKAHGSEISMRDHSDLKARVGVIATAVAAIIRTYATE
jgi:hypothetical protein